MPSLAVNEMVRRMASRRLICPCTMLSHNGALASSKSAINTCAPELSALMTILRSTGPVISVRRLRKSAGIGATFQSLLRICAVSGLKSGNTPFLSSSQRVTRRANKAARLSSKRSIKSPTNANASRVKISLYSGLSGPVITNPSGMFRPFGGAYSLTIAIFRCSPKLRKSAVQSSATASP